MEEWANLQKKWLLGFNDPLYVTLPNLEKAVHYSLVCFYEPGTPAMIGPDGINVADLRGAVEIQFDQIVYVYMSFNWIRGRKWQCLFRRTMSSKIT